MKISIIYGSVRNDRKGIKAARYLEGKLKDRDISVNFIDPLKFKLPLLDKMYKEYEQGAAPALMEKLAQLLRSSDGFLIVTGEYNHSVPPALKNLLDHFQSEYYFKPSALASYSAGSFGGVRAAVHMRVIAGELGMPDDQVLEIINKLESLKTFIYRSDGKGIDWAYPLSLENTGFRMTAASGERFFAA